MTDHLHVFIVPSWPLWFLFAMYALDIAARVTLWWLKKNERKDSK